MSALNKVLGIRYPFIQAPMAGGLLDASFVAEVSNFGFLGSIPTGYLSLSQIKTFIKDVQARTSRPFALNIFVDYMTYGKTKLLKPKNILEYERLFKDEVEECFVVGEIPLMDEILECVLELKVPIVSTTFGLLSKDHVDALKRSKVKILSTINSVYELELVLSTQSPDAIVFQSALAGGHKGGFTSLPYSENLEVLKVLKDLECNIPCILAGAIATKEDANLALEQGFDGVQVGSSFLCTKESKASLEYKNAIINGDKTGFTTAITGKKARAIQNKLSTMSIDDNLGFPFMHYATATLRKLAKEQGNPDYQALWCGEGISKIDKEQDLVKYMESLI
ncbi:hypothetical protein BKH43_00060 [Helicobacter sp. 13S00401-1]|uniref:NAD(P)H-dependent flavin oxidoreductase n=1 Tax=Helicobacter sp. 13S00401-1 TaxID=1905758 RepID=UPI000BA59F50|nr:nitronate monooxygenase [Helicobacter sp. 13S00401-1]PAF51673.1 hypothetical protein BKH43_00060 [Helicobacter sp. 13S00401-1]